MPKTPSSGSEPKASPITPRPNSPTLDTPTYHSSQHPSHLQQLADQARQEVENYQNTEKSTPIPPEYGPISPDTGETPPILTETPEIKIENCEFSKNSPESGPERSEGHKNPEIPQKTYSNPPIPVPTALLIELRRVRETVLPALYQAKFDPSALPAQPTLTADSINKAIILINGSLRIADYAMMDRDDGMMLAAVQQLRNI